MNHQKWPNGPQSVHMVDPLKACSRAIGNSDSALLQAVGDRWLGKGKGGPTREMVTWGGHKKNASVVDLLVHFVYFTGCIYT